MKAAIFRGQRAIEVEEVAVPVPGPGYVLLKMHNCGICGSDLHSYFGTWGQPKAASGHEVVRSVVECGEGVTDIGVGDRARVECTSHCGLCRFCRVGQYNLCECRRGASGGSHSGFAEYVVAHASALVSVPQDMSDDDAMMVEPLAVSHRAFQRSGVTYRIWFIWNGEPEKQLEATVAGVRITASDATPGYGPGNTLDGDLETRWSAAGDGQSLVYDFGPPGSSMESVWRTTRTRRDVRGSRSRYRVMRKRGRPSLADTALATRRRCSSTPPADGSSGTCASWATATSTQTGTASPRFSS